MLWARYLVGFCAMFMLVAIITGVITHKKIFADFFTFRWGKGQRSWLDAHAALSVLGLPFHFMITYSGLVMLVLLYMPWGADSAFGCRPGARRFRADERWCRPGRPRAPACRWLRSETCSSRQKRAGARARWAA